MFTIKHLFVDEVSILLTHSSKTRDLGESRCGLLSKLVVPNGGGGGSREAGWSPENFTQMRMKYNGPLLRRKCVSSSKITLQCYL